MGEWLDADPYEWAKDTDIRAEVVTVGLSRVDERHPADRVVLVVSFTDDSGLPRRVLAMHDAEQAQNVAQAITLCAHEIGMEQQ